MIRYLAMLAVVLTASGCREPAVDTESAGSRQQPDVRADTTKDASSVPRDSFRLSSQDARSTTGVRKQVFVIRVPSAAKRVSVFLGPVGSGSVWSLPVAPSSAPERECMFEVSYPVIEQEGSNRRVVVVARLSMPTSNSESPLTRALAADDTPELEDVLSFSGKSGLYQQDTPVVLGHLKLGVPEGQQITLYVSTSNTIPTKE